MPCNGRDAFRTTFFVIMSIAARYYRAVSLMSDRRCRYVVTRLRTRCRRAPPGPMGKTSSLVAIF